MLKHATRAVALVLIAIGLSSLAPPPATAVVDRDCGDFVSQAAAQAFMLASGASDPHGLDGSDNDGRACESNPCPCGTSAPQPFAGTTTSTTSNHTTDNDPSSVVRRNVGNVVRVTDGDTLEVNVHGIGIRDIRIIGIDTPEVFGDSQCGGRAASQQMSQLAPVGSTVVLLSDPSQADHDRYGRLLRYVERRGKDVGRAQVNLGRAKVYVYNGKPFRRAADYRTVGHDARVNDRGLWSTCWR